MNANQIAINAWRAKQGLEPMVGNGKTAKADKRQQNANREARAQACRDLKARRTSGKR